MKLNHLDLQVADVPAAAAFFVAHFGFEPRSNASGEALAFLYERDGFWLVLGRKKGDSDRYPDGFHIGFLVDDVETVRAQHARLTAAGVESGPIETHARGTMFYCRGPSEILIEVSCRAGTRFTGG